MAPFPCRQLKMLQSPEDYLEQTGKEEMISARTTGDGGELKASHTATDKNDHLSVRNGPNKKRLDETVGDITGLCKSPANRSDEDLFYLISFDYFFFLYGVLTLIQRGNRVHKVGSPKMSASVLVLFFTRLLTGFLVQLKFMKRAKLKGSSVANFMSNIELETQKLEQRWCVIKKRCRKSRQAPNKRIKSKIIVCREAVLASSDLGHPSN